MLLIIVFSFLRQCKYKTPIFDAERYLNWIAKLESCGWFANQGHEAPFTGLELKEKDPN